MDEGAHLLKPRRVWVASDLTITPADPPPGLPPEAVARLTDRVETDGSVDFGGLLRDQWVRLTTASQDEVVRVRQHADYVGFAIPRGRVTPEPLGTEWTIATTGQVITSAQITFTANTISIQGASWVVHPPSVQITITGSASNNGTVTVDTMDASNITTTEALTPEAPGATVTLEFEELWDYTVDLDRGHVHLRSQPIQPLAIDFRGPAVAGDTRAELLLYFADLDAAQLAPPASPGELPPSWEALRKNAPHRAGVWIGPDETIQVRDVLDRLALGDAYRFVGPALEVFPRELPSSVALELAYLEDCHLLQTVSTPPPSSGQVVLWGRNRVPLQFDQIVLGADAERAARAESAWQEAAEPPAAAFADEMAGSEEGKEIESPYAVEAGALILARRYYDQERYGTAVWRVETHLAPLALEALTAGVRLTSDHHPDLVPPPPPGESTKVPAEDRSILLVLRLELQLANFALVLHLWGLNDDPAPAPEPEPEPEPQPEGE